MSELIVPVAEISAVQPHANADRLVIATILGWQVVVVKDTLFEGDTVLYVPPDAMVPREWGEHWGVWRYLAVKESQPDMGRVRCARLRGEPSFGFAVPLTDERTAHQIESYRILGEAVGQPPPENFAPAFGITKYEPPPRVSAGDALPDLASFPKFTDIDNLRHYPDVFAEGEEVVITEKVHGANCRVGLVDGEWLAGSHRVRRKDPAEGADEEEAPRRASTYWYPLTLDPVRRMLTWLTEQGHQQVILYGEIYGPSIQKFDYGLKGLGFVAFDLFVDGKYLPHDEFRIACSWYDVPCVPLLYRGPFSMAAARAMATGPATLGGKHIREGVVVRPIVERYDSRPGLGRVVLKLVSDEYLLGDADQTDDV